MDKPKKVTWKKGFNFKVFHQEMKYLIGSKVVNKNDKKNPLTIFSVSEIYESEMQSLGNGFLEFLNGNPRYTTSKGEYNFLGQQNHLIWAFDINFGYINVNEIKHSQNNTWSITRTSDFETDVKTETIIIQSNHPFVHYPEKWKS